ncbi:MAG: helix-turn-helix transcriptional regulator [Kiritimatiellae bacterium]|nr:helix-turn-helix transcriptional regulator [Kiritimatiellia bacterium]
MSIFATRLKELRGTESQAAFSAAIGVNRVQYAKYESGQNSPSVDLLERICRVHACSSDWLLGLRDAGSETPKLPAAKATSPAPASPPAPGSLPQCAKCEHRKLAEKMRKMLAGGK